MSNNEQDWLLTDRIAFEKMVTKSWEDYVNSLVKNKNSLIGEHFIFQNEYYCRVCCMFFAHYLVDVLRIKDWEFDDNERLIIAVCNSTKHGKITKSKEKHGKYFGMNFSHLKEKVILRRGFLGNMPRFTLNRVTYPANGDKDLSEAMFQIYKKHFSEKGKNNSVRENKNAHHQ